MASIRVEPAKCVACGQCVGACPFGQIQLQDDVATIGEGCTLCGSCVSACPLDAIEMETSQAASVDLSDYKGILVWAEQSEGQVKPVTFELLGEARRLAEQLQAPVAVALLGEDMTTAAASCIHYGADRVYLVDDPRLAGFNDEIYAAVMEQVIELYKPEILLMGATTYGRSLAPRLASRLHTGLTADCTQLAIDPDSRLLLQTRPAFGGNLMATITCPRHRPQMATVRPGVMRALSPDAGGQGQIVPPPVEIPETTRIRVLEVCQTLAEDVDLTAAEVVVAAGKGVGSAANMQAIEELAQLLGGVVGATRPVVDAGWIDYSHQIGQTGKTVSPKLYIACGISGAVQHTVGMQGAETIVAINKDPEAPIFQIAHYSLVGDVMEIVQALIEELRSRSAISSR
ncbi:MAG: electron transfer flavoprotein subunit alpha [Firmicutes bacterium]|nr:electron transfer flavoprotein subunit alpha [Bacillota bacterium]